MSDESAIKVTVSGETVYKAVRNFLLNDRDFKKKVEAILEKVGVESTLTAVADRTMAAYLEKKFMYGHGIDRMIEAATAKVISAKVEEYISKKVDAALARKKFLVIDP